MGVGSSDDLSVPQDPSGDMDWVDDGWIFEGPRSGRRLDSSTDNDDL
jgi:hypothetical protein